MAMITQLKLISISAKVLSMKSNIAMVYLLVTLTPIKRVTVPCLISKQATIKCVSVGSTLLQVQIPWSTEFIQDLGHINPHMAWGTGLPLTWVL